MGRAGHGVAREGPPATIPNVVVKTNHSTKEEKSCHEATVRDPLAGAAEELAGVEEWDQVEEGWAAPELAPDREVGVCAPNVALLPPIKPGYPATKYSALSVAQPWSGNSNIHMTAMQSRIYGTQVK